MLVLLFYCHQPLLQKEYTRFPVQMLAFDPTPPPPKYVGINMALFTL